jgi:hypothetical protein
VIFIIETLSKWRIRIPVYGLQSVLWNMSDELIENKIKFNYRGNEHGGDVIVDSENDNDAIIDAMYLIDKALGRVCFAHNIGSLQ